MEKMNFNITQQNSHNKIFLILSFFSWALLAINNLASLKWLYREPYSVWNIYAHRPPGGGGSDDLEEDVVNNVNMGLVIATVQQALGGLGQASSTSSSIPLSLGANTIHKIFNFFFIITFIGCATLIFKTLIKKEQVILDGLFGKYSQFHFIPLLFGFAMSLLGELIKPMRIKILILLLMQD